MYSSAFVSVNLHTAMAVLVMSIACPHAAMCQDNTTGTNTNFSDAINITEVETESTTFLTTEFTTTKRTEVQSVPTRPAVPKNSLALDPWFVECEGCACDVTPFCDVACCCDPSCSEEDKLAFASCENYVSGIHQRHCLRGHSIFRNSTNNTLVSTSDGLFCIVPEKPETAVCHKYYEVFTTTEQFKRVTLKNEDTDLSTGVDVERNWPQAKYGLQIVIEVNGEYKYLGFPGASFGRCTGVDSVLYLINQETTCCSPMVFKTSCETKPLLNAATYYRNFNIVKGDERIPVMPCICQPSGQCSQDIPTPVYNISTRTCSNVLSQVRYKIFHNSAFGIKSIIAFILLQDQPDEGTKRLNWCPTFKVSYEVVDDSNTTTPECRSSRSLLTTTKSGNPGYLIGAPVLVGKWNGIDVNESSAYSLTQLVTSAAGDCSFVKVIKFGENVRTGCTLITNESNCEELANLTSKLFNASLDRIGVFGNVSPNRAEDWVPLLHRTSFKALPAADYGTQQFSSTCKLTVGTNLLVAIARVGSKTNPQSKIVGALLTKTEIDYVTVCEQFVCDFQMHHVHVSFAISFIDVS